MTDRILHPLVSVVIPVYNREHSVGHAIESVLAQTYANLEVIVVDDRSTDATREVVQSHSTTDSRVRLVEMAANAGAQAARNVGLAEAQGDWLAFLDSDDTWYPDGLERRLMLAIEAQADVVHSAANVVYPGREPEPFPIPPVAGDVYARLLELPGPMFQTLFVRTRALRDIGGLDEGIAAYQEWDTAIRLAASHRFAYLPDPTLLYDCRGTDTISKDSPKGRLGYEQVVQKHRSEIVDRLGRRGLAEHYIRLAHWYVDAGERLSALRRLSRAVLLWPAGRGEWGPVLRRLFEASTTDGRGGKRIGIVLPAGYVDTNPTLCSMAELFAERGYLVDFFVRSSPEYREPVFHDDRITTYSLPPRRVDERSVGGVPASPHRSVAAKKAWLPIRVWRALNDRIRDPFRRVVGRAYEAAYPLRLSIQSSDVRRLHRLVPYRCIVGVDPDGLWQAFRLARRIHVPVVYSSMEILFESEAVTDEERQLKALEKRLAPLAEFVIIQDIERAKLFAAENGVPLDRFVLAPNAPVGPARKRKSRHWHETLGLDSETRVLLHAGSVVPWTRVDEIVGGAANLPDPWVLVVHTKFSPSAAEDIHRVREEADPRKVYFSLEPVSRQEYETLVDASDAGVAFYVPMPGSIYTQQNLATIGLSSGKISYYLRAGLPVITNRSSSLGRLVERERIGVAVETGDDLGAAMAKLDEDYDGYSERAMRYFDAALDFRRSFESIVARLEPDL